ncbi:response regulator [Nocardioides sp. dk4132]|uniref:response regulator transcription factor n=1 Tax=unclassified Nocardioides TaxID=2615069 RepID=UPI001297164B|nr:MULTISPECIES: response regulator transcription factor [unclassified Nocardioides]MQW75885.1 response regulator [Nocardioides sp. dk4132]QGA08748.1 response regulator [Nocardioides sp. dk884]
MTGGDADWTAVIIEDDPDVRDLIDIVLTQSGFRTIVAQDGPDGVEAVRRHNPLLTTLDVNMPGMDGFAVAKRLREFSNTYLIMITALADEIDVVQGFEVGADDYLVKPFRPRELRARADSMLRRPRTRQEVPTSWAPSPPAVEPEPVVELTWAAQAALDLGRGSPLAPLAGAQATATVAPVPAAPVPVPVPVASVAPVAAPAPSTTVAPPAPPAQDGWVRFADLALNLETGAVTVKGVTVEVTSAELDLLVSLLRTGRRVRSKADLVLAMRGEQYVTTYFVNEADKRAVEIHIASLRRKLGDDGATPRYIETVRGVGYRMAEPV